MFLLNAAVQPKWLELEQNDRQQSMSDIYNHLFSALRGVRGEAKVFETFSFSFSG